MSINARATRAPDGGLILGAAWAVFVFLAYCIIALYKLYRKAAKPATADTQAERTGAPPTQPSQDASQVGLDARLCQTLPSVSPGDELRTIPLCNWMSSDSIRRSSAEMMLSSTDATPRAQHARQSGKPADKEAPVEQQDAAKESPSTLCTPAEGADARASVLQMSRHSQSLVAQVRSMPYKSKLTQHRVKMFLKSDVDTTLDSLPSDLTAQVQRTLRNTVHPGLSVLDMSLRHGCVMVAVDSARDREVDQGPNPFHVVEAMLPHLQAMVQSSKRKQPLQHGRCYALAQVGHTLLRVMWDEHQSAFVVRPCTGAAVRSVLPATQADAVDWRLSGACQLLTAASKQVVELQVWCVSASGPSAAPLLVLGWDAPAPGYTDTRLWSALSVSDETTATSLTAGSTAAAAGAPTVRLLARCQGSYISTRVTPADVSGDGSVLLCVQLDATQLSAVQPHHHVGGPSLGVVPLVLELWQGERWLSSSPLLLQTADMQPVAPATAATRSLAAAAQWLCVGCEEPAWWWGAGKGVTQAAVQDAQRLCDSACLLQEQASGGPISAMPDGDEARYALECHVEFMTDMLTWLEQVKLMAQGPGGGCTSRYLAPGRLRSTVIYTSTMSAAELQELAQSLLSYARSVGLTSLEQLVSQQLQTVVQPAAGAAAATASPAGQVTSFLQALRVSAVGSSCAACEQHYRRRLSQQLAGVQVLTSLASAVLWPIICLTRSVNPFTPAELPTAIWSLLHLCIAVLHGLPAWLRSSRGSADGYARTCSRLCVLAFLWRMLLELGMAVGALPLSVIAKTQVTRGDSLLDAALMSLGDQMQASALVPAPLILALATLEGLAHASLAWRASGWPAVMAVLTLLLVLAPRLLYDMRMRRLFASQETAQAATRGAKGGIAASANDTKKEQ